MEKGRYIYEWPRPMVTVDALIFTRIGGNTRVLLIKRGNDPFKGLWAVPGGFVDMDEELEIAAARELQEETGLKNIRLEQFHTFGKCGRDPRGRNITVVFWAKIDCSAELAVKGGDDAAEAKWFDLDHLPELAFDHQDVLAMAAAKLNQE